MADDGSSAELFTCRLALLLIHSQALVWTNKVDPVGTLYNDLLRFVRRANGFLALGDHFDESAQTRVPRRRSPMAKLTTKKIRKI